MKRFLSALAILTAMFQVSGASAQAVCPLIAKYFISPPSGFIAERGEEEEDGVWTSNQRFPNADCGIEESRRTGRHTVRCIFNSGASLDTVTAFGKQVERDVDNCLRRIPNGADYEKDTETDTIGSTFRTETSWTNEMSDATYRIAVSANRSRTGRLYNSMVISWTPKRRR
jgi:hypothetical protein